MNLSAKIFQIRSYLRYKARARGRHGTHSPLAYELVDKIFRAKINDPHLVKIEALRKTLLQNNDQIEIVDLGQGSHRQKGPTRAIKSIAKHALSPKKDAQLFYKLIKRFDRKNVLEIGTSLGITTLYMSTATERGKITTLEGCQNTAQCARKNFTQAKAENITLLEGEFDKSLDNLLQEKAKFDFAYIDGNHSSKATLRYLEKIVQMTTQDAIIVCDDIYWNADMELAWRQIVADNRFGLTVDCFNFGMIFRQPRLQKEHFILRYT